MSPQSGFVRHRTLAALAGAVAIRGDVAIVPLVGDSRFGPTLLA
jgi:hypothetical protein